MLVTKEKCEEQINYQNKSSKDLADHHHTGIVISTKKSLWEMNTYALPFSDQVGNHSV